MRRPAHQRNDRLAPESAIGLGEIGVGVVAGQAEQQRRHAEGERDLAGSDALGGDEIELGRGQRERLPVETALEQQRAAGIAGTLERVLQLLLEALELRLGQRRAFRPVIDQGAGGARGVVEQGLVPAAGGVVDVERDRRRLDRRQPVMIVDGVEQRQMQDRRQPALAQPETHRVAADRIVIGLGPAVAAGHHAHPVGPQRIEFARLAAGTHRLDIGVSGDEQVPDQHLAEGDAALARIGALDQGKRRMLRHLARADLGDERRLRRRFRDQADAAVHDRIALIALSRERDIVARRPDRAPCLVQCDQRPDARALLARRGSAAQATKKIEHGCLAVGA